MQIKEKTRGEAQASPTPRGTNSAKFNPQNRPIAESQNFLDCAMFYINHNIKVFPVGRQDKKPLCSNGFKSATDDLVVLNKWNQNFPDCNIGIPTGDMNQIFVVDVDGEIGAQSLALWEEKYGPLNVPTVLTGKGKHLYFKMPANRYIRCSVNKIANHIDIRGNGGYVVAPPSLHANGHQYTWQNWDMCQPFPDAPDWLLDLLESTPKSTLSDDNLLTQIVNAPQGTRNDTVFGASIKLINQTQKDMTMNTLKETIVHAAMQSGLSQQEASRTFNNALQFMQNKADTFSDTEPDMDILKTKILLPAPKFDTSIFKNLESWVTQTAKSTNAPVDYVAFSLFAGAASIIGLSRSISPGETWIEPCCLWIGTVGEPSSGKTPATTPVRRLLSQLEEERKAPYRHVLSEWKKQKEVEKQKIKEWRDIIKENTAQATPYPSGLVTIAKPQLPRFVYGDTTQEAIVRDMERNRKGAIVFRDELSAWITGMNRYNSGSSERGFWLESFNGNKFTTDRVKFDDERVEIKNLLISVFGTIQPQRLVETLLCERGDGFLARFLWVYPEPTRPCIPSNIPLPDTALKAFRKLETLLNPYEKEVENQKKCLRLSPEAQDCFNEWYISHWNKAQNEESILKHFLGKGQGYVLRFALVLELLWWASSEKNEPAEISLDAVQSAIILYDTYLVPMCDRVYNMYYSPSQNIEARTLARHIIDTHLQSFTLRDIYHNGTIPQLRRKEQAKKATDQLLRLNWLRYGETRAGTNAGRKRTTYYVNPEVFTLVQNA